MKFFSLMTMALLAALTTPWAHAIVDDRPFDPAAVVKELQLEGVTADRVRERLEAIKDVEQAFVRQRTAMETAFAAGLEVESHINALTARISARAEGEQKKIDALAAEISQFADRVRLPDLTEKGQPIFGRYRRPAPGQKITDHRRTPKTIESGVILRSLDIAFDHDKHPKLKTGCVECHKTSDESLIEETYKNRGKSSALLGRSEQFPTMDNCAECHYERGAIDDCTLCHPGYRKDKKLFSKRFNPFLRLKNGVPAPAFSLKDVEGKRFSSDSAAGERFLVIQFGSSTCPPYLKEVAAVSALAARYSAEPVTFITIYTKEASPEIIGWERWLPGCQEEMALRARACGDILGRHGVEDSSRMLVDQWPGVVSNRYGGLPNSVFIILPTGKVGWKAMRMVPSDVDAALETLLWKHRP